MTWPPRWDGPHFKEPRLNQKLKTTIKRRASTAKEDKQKGIVRARDNRKRRGCSVPLCDCRKFKLALHVSHAQHKGMGGNPAGDRSDPKLMLQVCIARHREHRISIDRGTLRWEPLKKRLGSNGPIAWFVRNGELLPALQSRLGATEDSATYWIKLGVESEPGKFIPASGRALDILRWMAKLEA